MQVPSIPPNEPCRLSTLTALNILDTAPEERFDRVTRVAKRLFNVKIACVSLVDKQRQWFKSAIGTDVRQTPRDISFCGHAILKDELFHISDATQDSRFANNPLVTEPPHVRFYAGQPLHAPNGQLMGTLCIIDDQPRQLTDEDKLALKDLAMMVEDELAAIELATSDELTGIANRRGFMALVDKSLQMMQRNKQPACLVYLDLDNFKPINDQYGHGEGDKVLCLFAQQMLTALRDSDIVGRFGGDEFAAFFHDCTPAVAQTAVKRFGEHLHEVMLREQLPYPLQFSYGMVAVAVDEAADITQLLQQADEQMYRHKHQKKGLTSVTLALGE